MVEESTGCKWVRVNAVVVLVHVHCIFQVQDKFVLHLDDEEAVAYLQNLLDESVSAMMAILVERLHAMAQVIVIWVTSHVFKHF